MGRKRLLFVHTGGTLGMLPEGDPGPLAPSSYAENLLPYVRGLEDKVDIEGEVFSNLDSTDFQPSHWEGIAELIASRMDDYDGFLVLHGTDTMAYTASALSFMLQNLAKPVVLTGSQRPVAEVRTDARNNLIHSALCATLDIPEVGLFFGSHLYRGNCATKVSIQSYEAFDSPNLDPLLDIGVDIRHHTPTLRPTGDFRLRLGFSRKVMVLYLFPGIRAGQLRAAVDAGAEGVVLLGFGAGNVPLDGWPKAIAEATEAGVPVILRSQSLQGDVVLGRYQGGAAAKAAGGVSARTMTIESTIVKTMFLLKQGRDMQDFRVAWDRSIAGEVP
jgi:L-asparaginase